MTPEPEPYEEFAAFARAWQPRLLRSAYLLCGDPHLAQDLLQSALVKVALRWSRLRHEQPAAYARTVLYRDAISWWRRRRREIAVAVPPEPRVNVDADEVASRLALRAALARLTPGQRAVVVLRFYEDLTEARTAQVLGVSVGTVKSQTAVALRRLRVLTTELSNMDELPKGARGGEPARTAPRTGRRGESRAAT